MEFSFVRRTLTEDDNNTNDFEVDANTDEVDPSSDILSIHRIVQMVIRETMERQECQWWLERIIAALDEEIVSTDYHDPRIRKANEVHLPHVRHVVAQMKNPDQMATDYLVHLISLLIKTTGYLIKNGN
ncbi:hypothetical protein BC936DRAFT_137733 [Jimgerdemannia flammicorona]|uniref:Uncharacterized protein n=1 Tax=Jimgerdemannia flammicorona TaxID=994334 RepID=A0A433DMS9_9FUNG|nr:hypothetical protein BC936DRAFT_137733 [Jimgerdemannia flammicorona]